MAIADVARGADAAVGTVYHHFADKRALLLALIDRWAARVAEQRGRELEDAVAIERDPRGAIHGWLRARYERLRSRPSIYLVVLGMSAHDSAVGARHARIERIAIERIRTVVEYGQARGFGRRNVNAAAAAFLVHHAIETALFQLLVGKDHPEPDVVLAELGEMICRTLLEDDS